MDLLVAPDQAALLAGMIKGIVGPAKELGRFGLEDPDLASACGVEVCALEARSILGGASLRKVAAAVDESVRHNRPVLIDQRDLETVSRLEGALALGNSRIGQKMAALEAEAGQEGLARLGGLVGLASTAVGLIKSLF